MRVPVSLSPLPGCRGRGGQGDGRGTSYPAEELTPGNRRRLTADNCLHSSPITCHWPDNQTINHTPPPVTGRWEAVLPLLARSAALKRTMCRYEHTKPDNHRPVHYLLSAIDPRERILTNRPPDRSSDPVSGLSSTSGRMRGTRRVCVVCCARDTGSAPSRLGCAGSSGM